MLQLIPIKTDHESYPFVENLLHESFPEVERRDDDMQRYNTDFNPSFTCYFIKDNDVPVGLITVWNLGGFYYLEHLVTSPAVRNKGYGRKVMDKIRESFPGVIVLEVERPEEEMSIRRIGFYKRCGFLLCEKDYMQPPYRKGGEGLPLYLMFAGADSIDDDFERIRDRIYKEVYNQ